MRHRITFLVGVAAAFIIAGTLFVLFVPVPERDSKASVDGRVAIEGVARESQPFEIVVGDPAGGEVLTGNIYRIEPSATVLDVPAQVTFHLEQIEDPSRALVYWFDPALEMWTAAGPILSQTESSIMFQADRLGSFSLGRTVDLDMPEFLTIFDELLESAPENTVGFETAVGYRDNSGPVILIPNSREIGGCGGIIQKGNRTERAVREEQTRIFIDDVETLVDLVFVARWFVNGIHGCAEGERLESF